MNELVKNDNATNWAELWKATAKKPDRENDAKQAARWNQRSDNFGKSRDGKERSKRTEEILKLLKKAGFKARGAKVLDIGCGPGALSIPLAKAGATVTAFDIASGMLDRLKETAENEKLGITTIEGSWYTADIDKLKFRKKFDLVIASMTPAVRDLETFERMIACSKGYCYYSNFIKRDMGGSSHQELHNILGEVPDGHVHGPKDHDHGPAGHEHGSGPGLVYPFMYLYTRGHFPLLRITHNKHSHERDWNEAADRAIESVEQRRKISDEEKKKVRAYYKSASKDGKYISQSESYTGMMVWKVGSKGN